jgi:hypothetical protein
LAFARLSECGCLRWMSMLGMSGFLQRVVCHRKAARRPRLQLAMMP